MSEYVFKLAGYGDADEVRKLYKSLVGTPGCTWHEDYPNDSLMMEDIATGSLYILKDGEDIVAVCSACPQDEDFAQLEWTAKNPCVLARIGVSQSRQGQGLGSLILTKVIAAAKERGYDGMGFVVSLNNHAALRLYQKNGCECCGRVFMYGREFYRYQKVF